MYSWNLAVLVLLLSSASAYAHARFRPNSTTPPRNESTGLKTGPCGGIARTSNPTVYKAGQEIKVQWEETINHPGYYIISFSKEGDADFEKNVLVPKYEDTQNNPLEQGKTHTYETSVKLPNVTCDACTLQLIQVMTEDPSNPRNYYSCSDIKLIEESKPDPEPVDPDPEGPTEGKTKPAKPTGVKVKKNN